MKTIAVTLPLACVAGAAALFLVPAAPVCAGGPPDDPAVAAIVATVDRATGDAEIAQAVDGAKTLVDEQPRSAWRRFAHGYALSAAGRKAEAAAEYRKAVELSPKLADAWYNLGNVAAALGKDDEALAAWDASAAIEPKLVDAYYNAGQLLYNRKAYDKALARWEHARRLAPGDFGILKKVIQATYGLDRIAAGERLRGELAALWKGSADEAIRKLDEYVFDQFDLAGKTRVMAFAYLRQPGEHAEIVYSFRAVENDRATGLRVEVETSEVARNAGTPYVLSRTDGGKYSVVGASKHLPSYPELRKTVRKLMLSR
jgi:tetratricopeptide (TPR) repeat protein